MTPLQAPPFANFGSGLATSFMKSVKLCQELPFDHVEFFILAMLI
jgi:hypothetical protein